MSGKRKKVRGELKKKIMELLEEAKKPLSLKEIYGCVKGHISSGIRADIYRLVQKGVVNKVREGTFEARRRK